MDKPTKNIIIITTLLGALTIAIGAFGAHGLKNIVAPSELLTFETGVRYQMYHVLALLAILLTPKLPTPVKKNSFYLFGAGMILFSGSLYLMVLDSALNIDASSFGFITPIGGLFFILGWLYLAYSVFKIK